MAKKQVEITLYTCDHVDPEGNKCTNDGPRDSIESCHICKKDLCSSHIQTMTVSSKQFRQSIVYYICYEHKQEFINRLIEKFGDTRPVAQTGYGVTLKR